MSLLRAYDNYAERFFQFSGRASRGEFWFFFINGYIVAFLISIVMVLMGLNEDSLEKSVPFAQLPLWVSWYALMVRRLHDLNYNGYWLFAILGAPVVAVAIYMVLKQTMPGGDVGVFPLGLGIVAAAFILIAHIILAFRRGNTEANLFGEPFKFFEVKSA